MARVLVPKSAEARAHTHPLGRPQTVQPASPSPAAGSYGLRPQDLHSGYALPKEASSAQTIAIVDAYNDPAAEADLRTYDEEFSLPACTKANGCFKQVNEHGESSSLPFPKTVTELNTARTTKPVLAEEAIGWGLEISLDIETARAVCQNCHILLVEASSPLDSHLEAAESAAESLGATEISNSWGGPEQGQTEASESKGPFNHPGTVITASAGDNGYLDWGSANSGAVEFPAASPHVVAVGGTRLELDEEGVWKNEAVWNGLGAGGGGCSTIFEAPPWQQALSGWPGVGCGAGRAVADVAADADPYTGVAVADSLDGECEVHWCMLGGTSLASPLVAGVFALAGGSGDVEYPAETLYANAIAKAESLHDVTSGSNGECAQEYEFSTGLSGCTTAQEAADCAKQGICLAGVGYDGPTGLGTPDGPSAFHASGGGSEEPAEEEAEEEPGPPGAEPPPPPGPLPGPGPVAGGSAEATGGSTGAAGDPEEDEEEEPEGPAGEASVLSALTLATDTAQAAQSSRRRLSALSFSFRASVATRVRVSLAKRMVSRRHTRWHTLHANATVAASRGHNSARLTTGPLSAGTYRLTLKPRHGAARSLLIHIR